MIFICLINSTSWRFLRVSIFFYIFVLPILKETDCVVVAGNAAWQLVGFVFECFNGVVSMMS